MWTLVCTNLNTREFYMVSGSNVSGPMTWERMRVYVDCLTAAAERAGFTFDRETRWLVLPMTLTAAYDAMIRSRKTMAVFN